MSKVKDAPVTWYVGAQNDALYVVAGDKPSPSNDYPRHDADRTAIAKVYEEKYANILAAAPELLKALKLLAADVKGYEPCLRPCHAVNVAEKAIAKAEGRNA